MGHGRGCPLVVHYWADLQSGARVALLWQHNANPSYKLASIPQYDNIVRTAGWAGSARAGGRWLAGEGGRSQNCAPYMGSGRGWLADDWPSTRGCSQHYCGGLDCGLPLMVFWQQKANAKC